MERRHQSEVAAGKLMCWQLCVCLHLSHLFIFSMRSFRQLSLSRSATPFARPTHTNWNRTGLPLMTSWRRLGGDDGVMTCMRATLCLYVGAYVSALVALPVKELLWPHDCSITPDLPLNIHTGVCELTYGVIVRCQWSLVCTAPTWKHSVEHSEPLMVSSGTWHQHCLVSRHFFFLPPPLLFSFQVSCSSGAFDCSWTNVSDR